MENIGAFALILAFALCLYALVAALAGQRTHRPVLVASAGRAVTALWVSLTVAIGALVVLFQQDSFHVANVAAHSNVTMPAIYKLSALWSGQEGSLLFWSWLLACYGVIAVRLNRRHLPELQPYVIATLMVVQGFFLVLNLFVVHPFTLLGFETSAGFARFVPPDGSGMNPLLQYWMMAIHPPMLYLGYIGFSVPFAFAMAALITRAPGEGWIGATRNWTMIAWLFQTVGVLLGARWAYAVLGWGGYWGWDPVENASLLPWLTGTAFLHSVMMQEKKGMMKVWNMVLVFTTFFLCIFGTFLTRSGIVSSVHTFALSPIGPYFVGFLGAGIVFSVWLILNRRDYLKSENQLESVVSRESSFLFNNLILLAACFAVLWGTLFPVITEAIQGTKITVGPPFFNKVNIPIGLFLLFLTGVGPLIAWRRSSLKSLEKSLFSPALFGLAFGALTFALGARGFYPLVSFILCGFVAATVVSEFYRGASAIRRKTAVSLPGAAVQLTLRNTRRYGGYIVHLGIVFIFIGFTGAAFNIEKQGQLKPGEPLEIGNFTLALERVEMGETDNYAFQRAYVRTEKNGQPIATMMPEKRMYKTSQQPTSEVAIRSRLSEDLYVVLAEAGADGGAFLQVFLNPLVNWIWLGGLVMALGTGIALVPNRPPPPARVALKIAPQRTKQKDEVLA